MKIQIIFEISTLDDSEVTQEHLDRILIDRTAIPNVVHSNIEKIEQIKEV